MSVSLYLLPPLRLYPRFVRTEVFTLDFNPSIPPNVVQSILLKLGRLHRYLSIVDARLSSVLDDMPEVASCKPFTLVVGSKQFHLETTGGQAKSDGIKGCYVSLIRGPWRGILRNKKRILLRPELDLDETVEKIGQWLITLRTD